MSPWANEAVKNDPNLRKALKNAGLDLDKEVPLCLTGETTPVSKKETEEEDTTEEGCSPLSPDPIEVGGYGKSNC